MTPDRTMQAAEWMLRISSGEADERALHEWLEGNAENSRAYRELTETLEDIDRFAGAPEMVSVRGEALVLAQQTCEGGSPRRPPARRFSRQTIAAAAAFLIVAAAAVAFGLRAGSDHYSTGIGERRTLALADGSQITLDAATQVEVDYSPQRRRLALQGGRARFNVVKDPLRPFTVDAGGKVVVATGTAFSVELLSTQLHVVLYEGRVEVMQPRDGGEGKSPHWTLEPGHELIASASSARLLSVEPTRAASWESGELAFTEEPLALAVERVNRYTREKVTVGDEKAARVRISGVFHAGDTDAFVDGVTTLFPVRFERRDDGVVLMSPKVSAHDQAPD